MISVISLSFTDLNAIMSTKFVQIYEQDLDRWRRQELAIQYIYFDFSL